MTARSSTPWHPLSRLPYVLGVPLAQGVIRERPEDFQVDEILGFSPDGAGEHLLLQIRKRNTNTEWLARQLAALAAVPLIDVSYAGLKDRYALTTQWFSVRLAGRPTPDWHALEGDDIQILQVANHGRKLRRGALQGNRFGIRRVPAARSACQSDVASGEDQGGRDAEFLWRAAFRARLR